MNLKKCLAFGLSLPLSLGMLAGCGSSNDGSGTSGGDKSEKQAIIYSNADEEAVTAMQNALDNNGY